MNTSISAASVAAPNSARVWFTLLGGGENFLADRIAADRLADLETPARDNSLARRRAITHFIKSGHRQFIDLGTGYPVEGDSIWEIASAQSTTVRAVGVERDRFAYIHNLSVAADRARFVEADLSDTAAVLFNAALHLDLSRPVVLLATAVLDFIPDPEEVIARYMAVLAPGSVLVCTYASAGMADLAAKWQAEFNSPMHIRERADMVTVATRAGLRVATLGTPAAMWMPGLRLVRAPSQWDAGYYVLVAEK